MFVNCGICLATYLDNWLLLACLEQEAVTHLANLSFVVNKEKCVLKPKQYIALLGLKLNSVLFSVLLSGERVERFRSTLLYFLLLKWVTGYVSGY